MWHLPMTIVSNLNNLLKFLLGSMTLNRFNRIQLHWSQVNQMEATLRLLTMLRRMRMRMKARRSLATSSASAILRQCCSVFIRQILRSLGSQMSYRHSRHSSQWPLDTQTSILIYSNLHHSEVEEYNLFFLHFQIANYNIIIMRGQAR